jgi:hypothetical protein
MPVTRSASPSVSVSPMRSWPWLGMPMMSPAQASSASSRSEARNSTGFEIAIGFLRAHMGQLHAALEMARGQAHEGHAVAVLGVHVGLHLEDEAGDLCLLGAIWRGSADCGCGSGP